MVAGVGALGLAGYLYRHRSSPGVRWFLLSFLGVALWCLAYSSGLLVFDRSLRVHLEALWLVGSVWTGPLFLLFALRYTGRAVTAETWQPAVLLSVPAAASGLLLTHPYHDLLWANARVVPTWGLAGLAYEPTAVLYVPMVFGLVAAGVGVLLLVETVVNYGRLYQSEATAVALSTVPPSVGFVAWLLGLGPVPQLNLAPALFVFHVVLDAYAFVGSNMFVTSPTTKRAAERSVIDDIGNPVIVLDTTGRVVSINTAAADAFELDPDSGLWVPLADLFEDDIDTDADRQHVTVTVDGRDREFVVVVSALTDPADVTVGRTLVFNDVTREREREQRLDVLNRVIRHNLRNEMTVIQGHAEVIADRSDDEQITSSAASVLDSGDRLLATGEKAREFERLREREVRVDRVDITRLLTRLVEDFEVEHPDATIDLDVPTDPVTVETDDRILSLVVSGLLENALVHADPEPHVRVSLSAVTDGSATGEIRIRDDGPGISASELQPILNGRETALEHGTGIGLWIVSWGLSILGGDIELTSDDEGTEARVRL